MCPSCHSQSRVRSWVSAPQSAAQRELVGLWKWDSLVQRLDILLAQMSICCSAHRPEDTAEIMFQQHLLSMAPFLPPAVRSTFPSLTWHNSAGPSGSLCNFCRALWLVLLPVEIAVPQRTGSVAVYFLPCTQGFLCTKLEVYKCEIHAEEGTRMPQDKVPPQYSYFSIKRINVTCKEPYFWRVP